MTDLRERLDKAEHEVVELRRELDLNRLGNGTPDRRAIGTPLTVSFEAPPPWLARSRRRSGDQGGEVGP